MNIHTNTSTYIVPFWTLLCIKYSANRIIITDFLHYPSLMLSASPKLSLKEESNFGYASNRLSPNSQVQHLSLCIELREHSVYIPNIMNNYAQQWTSSSIRPLSALMGHRNIIVVLLTKRQAPYSTPQNFIHIFHPNSILSYVITNL